MLIIIGWLIEVIVGIFLVIAMFAGVGRVLRIIKKLTNRFFNWAERKAEGEKKGES